MFNALAGPSRLSLTVAIRHRVRVGQFKDQLSSGFRTCARCLNRRPGPGVNDASYRGPTAPSVPDVAWGGNSATGSTYERAPQRFSPRSTNANSTSRRAGKAGDRGPRAAGPFASALPPLATRRAIAGDKPLRICRLDFQDVMPLMMKARLRLSSSASFSFRAIPSGQLPPPPAPPFPGSKDHFRATLQTDESLSGSKALAKDAEGLIERAGMAGTSKPSDLPVDIVRIGLAVSKANVSKFAVERNRVRTRFKAALREAMRREAHEGKRLMRPDHTYIVTLKKECFAVPMENLIGEARIAFGKMAWDLQSKGAHGREAKVQNSRMRPARG